MTTENDESLRDERRRRGADPEGSEPDDDGAGPDDDGGEPDDAADDRAEARAGAPQQELDRLREDLERERVKGAELRDALMRTAADFDNFRKRLERDRVDERKQAAAGVVKNLLPVLDAVGRALATASGAGQTAELSGFVEGIRMVESQLMDVLKQAGLEPVPTEGAFDPVHHEALMQEASTDAAHMTILDVFEPGYRLGGRLLRPARVKVAFNPGGAPAASEPDGSGSDGGADGDGDGGGNGEA